MTTWRFVRAARAATLARLVAVLLTAAAGTAAPVAQAADDEDARILHLARRASFGATRELVDEIRGLGRDRWLARQTAPATIADPELPRRLAVYPALELDTGELLARYQRPATMADQAIGPPARIVVETSAAIVTRAVHARAQLAEVMTDFWLNHFNVYAAEGPTRYTAVAYVRDAIRPHALGRFRDLLGATAASPAMLYYLDNYLSTAAGAPRGRRRASGLNENYARELLELHTLGVDGGYTQADVVEVARVFTGWTITRPGTGTVAHQFVAALHERGPKTVLGHTIAGGGRDEGERLLDVLAREPATAEHVARKLVSRLVADEPPEPLVERAKAVFLRSDGDVATVVATILSSDEMFAAEHRAAKVKSPLELVASALRAAHADVRLGAAAARLVGALGQPILRAEPPTGWAETADSVVTAGGMVTRFDVASLVAGGRVRGVRVQTRRWTELVQNGGVDALVEELLVEPPSATTRTALEEASSAGASPELLATLVLASPEFQQQ